MLNKPDSAIKSSIIRTLLGALTALFLSILWLVNLLPYQLKLALGKTLGQILYWLSPSRVKVARVNISLCFPDLPAAEVEEMIRQSFQHFGAGIIETAMGWWDRPDRVHSMTEIIGQGHMENALAKGKGVLLLGGHFSTLDLSAMMIAKYYKMHIVHREQTNPVLNHVMQKGRMKNVSGTVSHSSMRAIVRLIRSGEIVWYAPDQDMGDENSVYAPFFQQTAATLVATAKLAALTGAPTLMYASRRKEDDSGYIIELIPAPAEFPVEDEVENATMVNTLIAEGVSRAPAQYYWFHRRFKSQPGLPKGAIYQ